ncbi:MAG: ABC transporter substrate-binding protein [Rhodospirillales bacterium]|nr:MAG: ABC transporter substrate-binding protein [Rhodospirillales bacterium]
MTRRSAKPRHRAEPGRVLRAAGVGLLLIGLYAAAPAGSTETAVAFVRSLGDTAIRELAPNDITSAQREAKFRELLRANFDLPRITRFVLGRYARSVSNTQMERFATLYEDIAVLTYAQLFAAYEGHVFAVNRQLGKAGDKYIMVVSELKEVNGSNTARLDWQLLVRPDGYAVVDIRVEGVSMAIAQRDDYTAFLDKNGGDIAALLEQLSRTVDKLRAERAGARSRAQPR